jgi:hypothetical protein
MAGFVLFVAVGAIQIRDKLRALIPAFGAIAPAAASVGLFVVMAVAITAVNVKHWVKAPNPAFSPFKITALELKELYPRLPHGARLLFVRTLLDYDWSLHFIVRLAYRDATIFITELNGPEAQRIPPEQLGHYDHIFTFEDGHYVELDNADAYRSVKLDLRKAVKPPRDLGEAFTIGLPGALQYLVKGIQIGPPNQTGYWTLDHPELRFRLSSTAHHLFIERYFLPRETLQQTGPLHVSVYVNERLLDEAVMNGEGVYQHDVPEAWLTAGDVTSVRMLFHNPYIAPVSGDKLGVLLLSASFNPPVDQH